MTVISTEPALKPSLDAEIVAVPKLTPVTTPLATVATLSLLDVHVTPSLLAWTVIVSPLTTLLAEAVTWIVSKSTLIVIEPVRYPSLEAVIFVLPTATEVTKPESLTVAISGFSDSHLTPSALVAVS